MVYTQAPASAMKILAGAWRFVIRHGTVTETAETEEINSMLISRQTDHKDT
ncbi:MAG: hypothetical protein LUI10_04115 [Lachnospiraceae bacterium]|nr:hypothetical protein [Lachnospiraceae bacterium]